MINMSRGCESTGSFVGTSLALVMARRPSVGSRHAMAARRACEKHGSIVCECNADIWNARLMTHNTDIYREGQAPYVSGIDEAITLFVWTLLSTAA